MVGESLSGMICIQQTWEFFAGLQTCSVNIVVECVFTGMFHISHLSFQCENGLNVYTEWLVVHLGPHCFCRSVLVDVSSRSFCLPFSQRFFVLFLVACNGDHVCMIHSILLDMFEFWFYGLMNCLASGTIG